MAQRDVSDSSALRSAQQRKDVVEALLEDRIGELSVGQGARAVPRAQRDDGPPGGNLGHERIPQSPTHRRRAGYLGSLVLHSTAVSARQRHRPGEDPWGRSVYVGRVEALITLRPPLP